MPLLFRLPCIFKTWKFSLSSLTMTPTVSESKLTRSPHSNLPRESTPLAMSVQSCKSLGRISISCIVKSDMSTTLLFSTLTMSPVSPSYLPVGEKRQTHADSSRTVKKDTTLDLFVSHLPKPWRDHPSWSISSVRTPGRPTDPSSLRVSAWP